MRKSRISFSINKKQGKNEAGNESTVMGPEPPPAASQQSTLKPSSYYACRFCCKRFKSEKTYETHSKTKKHAKAVNAGRNSELTKSRTCAGCQQSFETRLLLTQHCKRNSHMPLVQKTAMKNPVYGKPYTEAEQEDPFVSIKYYSPYYCEVCDLDCVCDQHYQEHVKSTRHEKAVEKRAEQGKGALVDLDTGEVDTTDKCLVIMNKVEPATDSVSAYYCGICDTDCRSELAYTEHVTSKEHKVRMEGHGQMKISCDLCCMTFNSENNHKMHLKSKKHANNLAARQRLLPSDTDPEKESFQDLRDKIKRTISPPLENFDKIKVNIAADSAEESNARSVVVDIQADEEDAMEMGKPRVSLDKKEKKELEKKLKEDEEERGKWAKRREEEYAKKAEVLKKSSKWDSKSPPKESRGRGRGQAQKVIFKDKYKWVAPNLRNEAEPKSDRSSRERYSSKTDSKDHGSRERRSRNESRSDKRDKRDSKSERREGRRSYDDDKYASDSEDERVIVKKGERKHVPADDDENDDLRNIINKQREMVGGKPDDGKASLVFDYGHQSVEKSEKVEEKRTGLKGFFGGAFAHLDRVDAQPSRDEGRSEGDNYGAKVKDSEKRDVGTDMERTLLLELLKRQFPDIRYLTERQGGLELMQKIFGTQGMAGALADLGGTSSSAAAANAGGSVASDEGSVKSAQFKQDGNVLSLVSGEAVEEKMEDEPAEALQNDKRESQMDRRSRSESRSRSRDHSRERSRDRRRRSRSRSDSRSRSGRKRSRYTSRRRSRSSSRDRSSKRSRRTPTPEKRKKDEKAEKGSEEKDESKRGEKDKDSVVAQVKAQSKDAKKKVLAKWTVSNWSGGNEEAAKEKDEKKDRKKVEESKESERKEDKRKEEKRKEKRYKQEAKEEDSRKVKRKEESKSERVENGKKRQRTNSEGDKIFEDASDYEGKKDDLKGAGSSKLGEEFENRIPSVDEERRKKTVTRYNYEERAFEDEKEMGDPRESLQKDLLANLARVENLGRGLGPLFPIGGGPYLPPLSGPPPPHGLVPLPVIGGAFPPRGLVPGPRGLGEGPPIPVNPNSALKYIRPTEEHNPPSRQTGTSAADRALKTLLSQVSALGGSAISTSSISALRPTTSLSVRQATGEETLPAELHRLGEEYADEFEASDEPDDSSSKPLKSILKKQSKFSLGQTSDSEQASGLPKHAVGAEYVVSTGEQAKYFCQLCDVQFATLSAKNLHLRGPKHLAMFMKHKSPLIDEMIRQAMGSSVVKVDHDEAGNEGDEQGKSELVQVKEEPKESRESPSLLTKRSAPSPETLNESSKKERERSVSPGEPRLYIDERTGRIVQAGGYYDEERGGRGAGDTRDGNREGAGAMENTQVPREDEEREREDRSKVVPELGTVPTPDEYDRLSQRAKDVLSREEYAQLPASTRKLLLLETIEQAATRDKRPEPGRPTGSEEAATTPLPARLADKDFEQGPLRSVIKDYEDLSLRARSLLTRDEYERLPARDKEYLSREEYLGREDYHQQTSREIVPRDSFDDVTARERLARDVVPRESYERLADRERFASLDRLSDRDRLALSERDRLALADRDRLSLADRDRLALADRDRRDYFDRHPPRDELAYAGLRAGPDEYARERGRPAREDYGRYMEYLDDDLAKRMEEYARQRRRDDYGRPLSRGGYTKPGHPDDWGYRGRGDPRDERPPPGRDYRAADWEMGRSRELYGDPRARDPRVGPERGGPPGYEERRMSAPREWSREAEGGQERPQAGGQEAAGASSTGAEPPHVPEGNRRPDEAAQKGVEIPGRYGAHEARPMADRREVTDTQMYGQQSFRENYNESDPRYHGRDTGPNTPHQPDQYDYSYDAPRRGGGVARGHRGRGGMRGGPRGQPRNAGNNRGQPRPWKGGQGRF